MRQNSKNSSCMCCFLPIISLFSPSPRFRHGQKGSFWKRSTQALFPHHSQAPEDKTRQFSPSDVWNGRDFVLGIPATAQIYKISIFLPQRANKCHKIQPRGGFGVRTSPGLTCELLTLCGREELTFLLFPGRFPTPKLMFMAKTPGISSIPPPKLCLGARAAKQR